MLRYLAVAAFALATFTVSREASAFCRTTTCDPSSEECIKNDNGCVRSGVPVIWAKMPITYRIYKKGSSKIDDTDALKSAVKKAFHTWEKVECDTGYTSVAFEEGPDITTNKPVGKKEASAPFGIYFRDDSWGHDDDTESLALTNQIYGERSGTIDYADIEVNTADNKFSLDGGDGTDFVAVMIHEAGHYLGLAHSNKTDSIMVPSYCQNQERCSGSVAQLRELSEDDKSAVCALYPPEGNSDSAAAPTTGSCSTMPISRGGLVNCFALVFVAGAIVRRRLRS